MTNRVSEATFEDMLLDPSRHFDTPHDVVEAPELDAEQRKSVLRRWRHDAKLLLIAEQENMGGGEKMDLAEINRALKACDKAS